MAKDKKDWSSTFKFPSQYMGGSFNWIRPSRWADLKIAYDSEKQTITVYLNGEKLVTGRKKMTPEEFEKMVGIKGGDTDEQS